MPSSTLNYRLRIRTGTDEADLLSVTTVRDGLNPYIESPPEGDGSELDPLAGKVTVGAYTVKVIDAPGLLYVTSGSPITDGWEYANQAAAEAAGWVFTDEMSDGSITVGAADQVHAGSKSLKMTTTGTGELAGDQALTAAKTFTSSHGIVADQLYTITVYGRMDTQDWFDNHSRLIVNGVVGSLGGTAGAFHPIVVQVRASSAATLKVTLSRTHSYVSANRQTWWDDLSIQGLVATTTLEGRVVTTALADLDGRQQLMSKPAIVEESEDEGATWTVVSRGYINRVAMLDALLWELTVGDSKRVEQSRRVFDRISDPGEHPLFIGTLDRASCLMGGPIVGDWGGFYTDRGRPAFEVLDDFGGGVLNLGWTNDGGSLHAIYKEDGPPMAGHVAEFINNSAREYVDPDIILASVGILDFAPAPDLICRIYDYDTSAWVIDVPCVLRRLDGAGFDTEGWGLVSSAGHFSVQWDGASPGDKYRFAVFPRTTSDRNPMHWSGHPMDLVANILDFIDTPYNLASLQAMGEYLGLGLKIHLRITQGNVAQKFLEETVYGLFGIAARLNDDGELEFVPARAPDTASSGTVTEADIAGELTGTPWMVDEGSTVNRVIVETHGFIPDTRLPDSATPFDAIRDATFTCDIKPPETSENAIFGDKEVRYTLPGSIQQGNAILKVGKPTQESGVDVTAAGTLDTWCANLAQPLFDWQGRGAIRAELDIRRGVTDAKIGDVLTLDLGYFPSANPDQSPVSQRGTDARRAVILKRTVNPDRVSLLVEDRGLAETLDCLPEFTLAADATYPKTTVSVTVTNEADLTHPVRVEMATGASAPTDHGQFVRLWRPNLDANPFTLPPVCAGNTVGVRMRCEVNGQVGDWTDWQGIDLDDLTAPSALSAVVNNTTILVSWTNGETTYPVEILARLDTDTTLQSMAVLPAGSTSYTLLLTQASTSYTIGVRYLDPKGCTSSTTTIGADTDVAICLDPPTNLAAFADGAGTYGVELDATVLPGGVEIWAATETAVDSGVAGSYTLVDTVVALQPPLRTRWTSPAPVAHDGRRRFLKAASNQAGYTSCGFSDAVLIDPWTLVVPGDPVPDPEPTDTALTSVILSIPLIRAGVVGLGITDVGSGRAVLTSWRGAEEKIPLDGGTAARVVASIADSTLPVGAYVAVEFEAAELTGDWHPLEDSTDDSTLDGPTLDVDPDTLDTLDDNSDEDAWVAAGPWVEVRAEAATDVRVRGVIGGGDTTGLIQLTDVTLQVRIGSQADIPSEIDDPITEDPGSCDVPGALEAAYANQTAAFAGWPED